MFDAGQFLTGWAYNNLQLTVTIIKPVTTGDNNEIKCDSSSTADGEGEVSGFLKSPGGNSTKLNGNGSTKSKRHNSPGGLSCSVPEPSTVSLFGAGLAAFLYSAIRKKRSQVRFILDSRQPQ